MKGLPPLPVTVSWEVQIILWAALIVISILGAIVVWAIKRYIEKNDKHHENVEATLKKHGDEFKARDQKFTDLTAQMTREANKIESTATDMRKTQADFQVQINKELLEIHKATSQIKTDLTDSNSKVGLLKKDLEGLIGTVDKHQKSLSLGAQALHKQREELANVRTEIVRISEELVIIKDKKPKS